MEQAGGGKARRDTGRLVDSTQAEDRRMISLVAARPLLYARSTLPVASYYSQVKQLWQEVADLMGWTVAEVRRKWSHIRNSYSRHLRNEIHGMRTGRGRMVSRWYLADDLEFLRQHMATDTRPSSQYSVMSPFAPSMLELEVSSAGEEDVKPGAAPPAWLAEGPGAAPPAWRAAGPASPPAWYAAPEPAPAGDSSLGFEPDENAAYFHFFRGIYKDYRELAPHDQRLFRRQCLILLHSLVDGPQAGPGAEAGGAVNLSRAASGSDSDKDTKCFVKDLNIINGVTETNDDSADDTT